MPHSMKAYERSQAEETLFPSVSDLLSANRSAQKRNLTTKSKWPSFLSSAFTNKTDIIRVYIDLGPAKVRLQKWSWNIHTGLASPHPSTELHVGKQAVCHHCEATAAFSSGDLECCQAWEARGNSIFT